MDKLYYTKETVSERLKKNVLKLEPLTRKELSIIYKSLKDHNIIKGKIIYLTHCYPRYLHLEKEENKRRWQTLPDKFKLLLDDLTDFYNSIE